MSHFPPTIIAVHPKERRSKCSVEPLRGRDGFVFWKYPESGSESLNGYVRLGIGEQLLSSADQHCGLFVLDATWRLAARMEQNYAGIPVRSLPPLRTAYPRTSSITADPTEGLATIEAIYAAYRILGREVSGLLDDYYWADEFLANNQFE